MKLRMVMMTCVTLTCLCIGLAGSDTLVLKNGNRVSGTVVDPEANPITLRLPQGTVRFNVGEVSEIIIDDAVFESRMGADPTKDEPGDTEETEIAVRPAGPFTEKEEKEVNWLLKQIDLANEEEEDSGFSEERQNLVEELAYYGPEAAKILETAFRTGNPDSSPYVLASLVAAAPKRGIAVAESTALEHKNSSLRAMAVSLIAENEPEKALSVLQKAAKDKQGAVRIAALTGLANAGSAKAIPTLIEALSEKTGLIQMAAIRALQACSGQKFKTAEEWVSWHEAGGKTP